MNSGICKLCNSNSDLGDYQVVNGGTTYYECSKCGKYHLLDNLQTDIDIYEDRKDEFYKISSYIYEQNTQFNITPKIDKNKLEELLNLKDKRIKEKFDLMMNYLSNVDSYSFRSNNKLKVESWIKDDREFSILYQKAIDHGMINGSCSLMSDGEAVYSFNNLTFDGIEYVESLEHVNKNSKNIFVAFNFEDNLKEIFNTCLKVAIEKEGFNYVVVNQDNVDHNKSINDEIIVKLKSSRIVIADFTNHRPSVYFEAGYAMGMNIPIIWTCQEGHENDMSFDTRQFPHIIWEDENDLVKQVIDRIKVIL